MDLEIRGAGNLLGAEQSGHIAAVGFEMYCRLLERTVQEMKGEVLRPEVKAQINLAVDIKIPEEYIPDFSERLVVYKKVSSAGSEEELARIRDEVRDLYGEIPRAAENLLALGAVHLLADQLMIRAISYGSGRVQIRFSQDAPISPEGVVRLASSRPGVSLTPAGVLRLEQDGAAAPPGTIRPAVDQWRIAAVLDLLKSIRAGDSMRAVSQPTAVGPPTEDR
jgi:transcription-repair coupling factor (superfamily II helicase)